MLTFARGVYNSLFVEETYKVLIIGLESSGKTTLAEQLKYTYADPSGTGVVELPTPAPPNVMSKKRIRPTIGLNMSRLTHRSLPPLVHLASRAGSLSRAGESTANSTATTTATATQSLPIHHTLDSTTNNNTAIINALTRGFIPVETRLVLWDVGGSLRSLWANYFASCHGVIFVVDSTLGTPRQTASLATSVGEPPFTPSYQTPSGATSLDASGVFALHTEKLSPVALPLAHERPSSAALRKAYASTAAVLRAVFQHPLLSDAPLLILSNKVDALEHSSMAELQEALGVLEMALMRDAYDSDNDAEIGSEVERFEQRNEESGNGLHEPNNLNDHLFSTQREGSLDGNVSLASWTSTNGRSRSVIDATAGVEKVGTSGIGRKIVRLMEASALDGRGLREAMDWLTAQMRDSKREAVEADG